MKNKIVSQILYRNETSEIKKNTIEIRVCQSTSYPLSSSYKEYSITAYIRNIADSLITAKSEVSVLCPFHEYQKLSVLPLTRLIISYKENLYS